MPKIPPTDFSINVGDVSIDESSVLGVFSAPSSIVSDEDNSTWGDYKITNRYYYPKNIWQMGIASSAGYRGKTAAFTQLSAPTLIWVCDWTVLRSVTKPLVPNPELVGSEWVLLQKYLAPYMLGTAVDFLTPLFRLTGRYIYGHTNPSDTLINEVKFPKPPWLQDVIDRTINTQMFQAGISTPEQSRVQLGQFIAGQAPTPPASPGTP